MSVSNFAMFRVTSLRSNVRSHLARSYASNCSQLQTIASRYAASFPKGGALGWRSTAGMRAMSHTRKSYLPLKPEGPIENSSVNTFANETDQQKSDLSRSHGYVVIKGSLGRDNAPFLQFGPFFLRENCQCSTCIHPDTKQRIVDTFKVPADVTAREVETAEKEVKIKWSDGHESIYPWDWLLSHQQNVTLGARDLKKTDSSPKPRDHSAYFPEKGEGYPTVLYEDVMSKDESELQWLEQIWKWGFCFIKGVPVDPESTKTLIERIAFIRHTHYGGFWDFTADLTFKDTAYTNEFLGGHTDNTYFTDPARLQLFHLLSHTDGHGGASLLVDGYSAARTLRQTEPDLYHALTHYRHPWHASGNEDVCIQPSAQAPVLSVHPDMNTVYQIRWNNYDRAPKSDWELPHQKLWYEAAARYNEILNDHSRQIWTQLEPGTALIFDNWRMLHGRSEFTGKRRMCGGYVNNDDFVSRFRLLKYGREKVLNNLGNMYDAHSSSNPNSIY